MGMIVVILLVVVAGVAAYRAYERGMIGGGRSNETPLEMARRRYASGEISREEFEQIKRDLS